MKKLSLFFQIVMLLVVAGCTSERLETVQEKAITNLVATLPATTRAHLNSTSVEWDNTDELGVFSDSHSALVRYTYSSQNSDGAVFHGDKVEGTKNFYAFYPYKASSTVNGTKITYTLPTEQIYAQGSFATGVCPMAAASTDQKFYFKQTCGIVRVNLTGTGVISKIVLRGNNNELLSGPGEVDLGAASPGFSVLSGAAGAEKVVRMACNVQLSSTATSFYFVIPAQIFTKGLNITITGTFNGQEKELVKNTDKVVEIPRAIIKNFTAVDTNAMLEEEGTSQRDILIALYEAMGGKQWKKQDNWCTDADLSKWYGVSVDHGGKIAGLALNSNNLVGEIPVSISELQNLTSLSLADNSGIVGKIPEKISTLTKLSLLDLSYCQLSGTIPASLGNLKELQALYLQFNQLSGDLPTEITSLPLWKKYGWACVNQEDGYNFTFSTFNLTLPDFTYPVFGGEEVNSVKVASSHEYTVVYGWATWCPYSKEFHPTLAELYHRYKNHGLDIIGICCDGSENKANGENLISLNKMNWHNIMTKIEEIPFVAYPTVLMFDKTGKLVFHSSVHDRDLLAGKLKELLGDGDNPDFYTSSDYSKDGKVITLQTATLQKGEQGVDMVLLGDGFSDRMIAKGDYESVMRRAMAAFFSEEPYRSFQKYFNVYSVVAVSENEEYSEGAKTKFSCGFGDGTYVYGNNELCFDYAQKVPSLQTKGLDDALIVVMLNSPRYAGTCYMYYISEIKNNYGRGVSVSYFPLGTSDKNLATVLLHEAGGHGFAKLNDEYAYKSQGQVPLEVIANETLMYNDYGWSKNVDFTSDVTQVKWAKFITDSRYAGQGLGVFEGACTYWKGAYRPTDNSIMNDNTGGFNAPSREAIYYRIHKLVHGNDWVYNYEDFVQWDGKNRSVKRTIQAPRKDFVPLHPPVKILGTWK